MLENIAPMAATRLTKIVAGLFFGSAALATAAHADAKQDQDFYWLLTDRDQDHPMVIWNFAEVRAEAIAACRREDAGMPPSASLEVLERPNGPYSFDDANSITSSAETIYCPWHSAPSSPGGENWVNASAPVNPSPVYAPIEWYPPPAYNPLGGGQGY